MVTSDEWQVIARDPDLNRRGYLPWTTLTLDHRHADMSAWTLTMPATPQVMAKLGPGWGAIILRNGIELMSGPLEDDGPRTWSATDDGGPGTITVTGADDLAIVANELAYPDPTATATSQGGVPTPADPVLTHAATGGTVAAGTYQVATTYINARGTTLPSNTVSVTTTGSTSTITVDSPPAVPGATGWYAYVTSAGGDTPTRQQDPGSPTAIGTNYTLTAPPKTNGAGVPGSNSTGGPAQDVQTGPAETVIKHYVSANVGTTRAAARGDASAPHARLVTVAADQGRGDDVTFSARFDSLLDIIQTISQAGSNLGAEVIQVDSDLVFDVYEPRDLTARMRFSRTSGTLTAASTTVSMPTLTHAVVLGSGSNSGAAVDNSQVIAEVDDSATADDWRMIVRQTVDSSGVTDAAQMATAGQSALTAGKRQYARDVTIVETPQVRYPDTIKRGDLVTIVDPTRPGVVITDIISSAHIEVDASAGTKLVQINVGTTTATTTGNDLTDQLIVVKRLINQLQRRTP